jgi:hypothetical protein
MRQGTHRWTQRSCQLPAARGELQGTRGELFLFQLGDNALEELFAWVRTLTHQRTLDMLELGNHLSIIGQVLDVYDRRPDWRGQRTPLPVCEG